MGFNPFQEKGTPIDKQFKSWSDVAVQPYDSHTVNPYTRTRCILMNGIESDAVFFYHHFHRHCDEPELKKNIATIRKIEQQEQKMVNWLIPADETVLDVTIGYEQLATDLTSALAKSEPDPNVKQALDFALLEDFDHLYRYANLMVVSGEKKGEQLVKELTEIMPGRPTVLHHRHPQDSVRSHYDRQRADIATKLHVATIIAAEQQTMNFYMNVGNRINSEMGRSLYQEIAQVEEDHVTHYGSLEDPRASWYEMAVLHEYNECWLYYSCMETEVDQKVKKIWQMHLENELTHLQLITEVMKNYEKRDAQELFPLQFPAVLKLEPSKQYVRQVLAEQFNYTGDDTRMVPMPQSKSIERFKTYNQTVNGNQAASQNTIVSAIQKQNQDYRLETEGSNPVEILRDRKKVPSREELVDFCMKYEPHAQYAR